MVCSVGPDHELVGTIHFEPVERAQDRRRHDPGGPDDEIGPEEFAGHRADALCVDSRHALRCAHIDIEPGQQLGRRCRQPLVELRQDARRRFKQRQPDVARGIEMIEAVARVRAGGLADLGREFDPGRAGSDDDDVHLRRLARGGARVGAHAGRDQSPVEPFGIFRHVERHRVLLHSRHAEVVADAADADHERVVFERAPRQDLLAVGRMHGVERDPAMRAIETGERPLHEAEAMPVRERRIVEIVCVGVHAAGRDFVQQRLPDVGCVAVDQGHTDRSLAAVPFAEPRGERQAAGAAADDHDPVRGFVHSAVVAPLTTRPERTTARQGLSPIA